MLRLLPQVTLHTFSPLATPSRFWFYQLYQCTNVRKKKNGFHFVRPSCHKNCHFCVMCKSIWYRTKPGSLMGPVIPYSSDVWLATSLQLRLLVAALFSTPAVWDQPSKLHGRIQAKSVKCHVCTWNFKSSIYYFYSKTFCDNQKVKKNHSRFFIDSLGYISEIKELPLTSTFFSVK